MFDANIKSIKKSRLLVITLALVFLSGCSLFSPVVSNIPSVSQPAAVLRPTSTATPTLEPTLTPTPAPTQDEFEGKLVVEVIDVGKGDCILIITPDKKAVLVDTAEPEVTEYVLMALNKHNVSEIEWAVFTHPHNDHVGGSLTILNTYKVNNIFMPNVAHTTDLYKSLLKTIKNQKINTVEAKLGAKFSVGDVEFNCLSPKGNSYKDMNDFSAVLMVTYKSSKILLMGDATTTAEKEILKQDNISADVIKIAHHGSKDSSSKKFLKAVNPTYAAVSCLGPLNGTPSNKVKGNLEGLNIKTFETDLNGDIYIISDGKSIFIKTAGEPSGGLRK